MISTEFYKGQGLGNQIWCYVSTRAIARQRGYDFGIVHPELFKGLDFLSLDMGSLPVSFAHTYEERAAFHPLSGSDVRLRDEGLMSVADGTKIDGYMQDEQLILPYRDDIKKWLAVKPEWECSDFSSDGICVINFRGTGYVQDKDFFLPKKYWRGAMANMRKVNPNFRFVVVTEDVRNARKMFPGLEVFHWSIAKDYVVIKNAHYLILSNSSFAWFPAWTSDRLKYCIAPKHWGRHNISDGYWSLGYSITDGWMYQDRKGELSDAATCRREFDAYVKGHADMFAGKTPYIPSAATWIKNKANVFNIVRKDVGSIESARRIAESVWAKAAARAKTWARKSSLVKRVQAKVLRARHGVQDAFLIPRSERRAKKAWMTDEAIAEYRKKIKIYDVFPFFNELDLLEIRLNVLDPYVDHFVIVECTKTFSGHDKPLNFQANRDRFKKWEHKIIYHAVTDAPADEAELRRRLGEPGLSALDREIIGSALESSTIGRDVSHWVREFYIKESIKKALVGLSDDDICYLSDLDEFWNPELVIDYSKDSVFKLIQKSYAYYLNNRTSETWRGWSGTIVTKYKNVRTESLNHLRALSKMHAKYVYLRNGGWHFGFQGGFEGAMKKIVEAKHEWYSPEETLPNLRKRVAQNRDFRGRDIRLWVDNRGLPKYILENREKYQRFFR